MEDETLHSIDHTSTDETGTTLEDGKTSKRERLKGALNRTKEKIHKVREEREVKKQQRRQEKDKLIHDFDDDVNDFLAAGRTSIASNEPPNDHSTLYLDNSSSHRRPSTSDSKTQQSPKRISVPRIDVSSSQRFPNAKEISRGPASSQNENANILHSHAYGSDFLKPAYNLRSQSSHSIVSQDRKARIRGLSVGFSDSPPVIIGEGGDEAMTPPLEISKAKARARSASPQGRKPLNNASSLTEARGPLSGLGGSDMNADQFSPKPLGRVQTRFGWNPPASGPDRELPYGRTNDDPNSIPRNLTRTQTGGLDPVTKDLEKSMGFSSGSPSTNKSSGMNATRRFENTLGASSRSPMLEKPLTKEFEMTLGLSPKNASIQHHDTRDDPQILAPKPQRAPPSYTMIEDGPVATSYSPRVSPVPPPSATSNATLPVSIHPASQASHQQLQRKPIPSPQNQNRNQEQQYQYPPPATRPRAASQQENGNTSDSASRILGPITIPKNDQHRSFADRQHDTTNMYPGTAARNETVGGVMHSNMGHPHGLSPQDSPQITIKSQSPFSSMIRRVSPSEKLSATSSASYKSAFESPHTAMEPSENTPKFYRDMNQQK